MVKNHALFKQTLHTSRFKILNRNRKIIIKTKKRVLQCLFIEIRSYYYRTYFFLFVVNRVKIDKWQQKKKKKRHY